MQKSKKEIKLFAKLEKKMGSPSQSWEVSTPNFSLLPLWVCCKNKNSSSFPHIELNTKLLWTPFLQDLLALLHLHLPFGRRSSNKQTKKETSRSQWVHQKDHCSLVCRMPVVFKFKSERLIKGSPTPKNNWIPSSWWLSVLKSWGWPTRSSHNKKIHQRRSMKGPKQKKHPLRGRPKNPSSKPTLLDTYLQKPKVKDFPTEKKKQQLTLHQLFECFPWFIASTEDFSFAKASGRDVLGRLFSRTEKCHDSQVHVLEDSLPRICHQKSSWLLFLEITNLIPMQILDGWKPPAKWAKNSTRKDKILQSKPRSCSVSFSQKILRQPHLVQKPSHLGCLLIIFWCLAPHRQET